MNEIRRQEIRLNLRACLYVSDRMYMLYKCSHVPHVREHKR